jgi:hypothetical protein
MKTIAQSLADAAATLEPIGQEGAIVEADYLAVMADLVAAMQAGACMWLPSQGASPKADSVTGTSWQSLDIFGGGSATPDSYGIVSNPTAGTMTVDSGGDGVYLWLWHASAASDEEVEFALQRTRDAATIERAEDGRGANGRGPALGFCFLGVEEGDVLRVVARTNPATTANLQFWSAQLLALRVLPKE